MRLIESHRPQDFRLHNIPNKDLNLDSLNSYIYNIDMPGIMTYIRQADYDKYIAIQSKGKGAWTEFIHNALNQPENIGKDAAKLVGRYLYEEALGPEPKKDKEGLVTMNTPGDTVNGSLKNLTRFEPIKTKEDVPKLNREGFQPIPKSFSARKKGRK